MTKKVEIKNKESSTHKKLISSFFYFALFQAFSVSIHELKILRRKQSESIRSFGLLNLSLVYFFDYQIVLFNFFYGVVGVRSCSMQAAYGP
jgi:hypothetical protein